MNIIFFKVMIVEKRRTDKFGICESKLNTFFHDIMNVSCYKKGALFRFTFFRLFDWSLYMSSLINTFDVHDRSSIVVVSQTYHDSRWWMTFEKSCFVKKW